MSHVSDLPVVNPPPSAVEPPQAQWIPRLIHEVEAPFIQDDPQARQAVQSEEVGILELMRLCSQPWTVASTQLSWWNLTCANLGQWQADWIEAGWRYVFDLAGALPRVGLRAGTPPSARR